MLILETSVLQLMGARKMCSLIFESHLQSWFVTLMSLQHLRFCSFEKVNNMTNVYNFVPPLLSTFLLRVWFSIFTCHFCLAKVCALLHFYQFFLFQNNNQPGILVFLCHCLCSATSGHWWEEWGNEVMLVRNSEVMIEVIPHFVVSSLCLGGKRSWLFWR